MSIRKRLLLAISSLFFTTPVLALEDNGYLALSNAGYVSVSTTLEARSHVDVERKDIYRDRLIDEEADSMDPAPVAAFDAASDE